MGGHICETQVLQSNQPTFMPPNTRQLTESEARDQSNRPPPTITSSSEPNWADYALYVKETNLLPPQQKTITTHPTTNNLQNKNNLTNNNTYPAIPNSFNNSQTAPTNHINAANPTYAQLVHTYKTQQQNVRKNFHPTNRRVSAFNKICFNNPLEFEEMLSNKTEYPSVLKYDTTFKITSNSRNLTEKSINTFPNQIFDELNKDLSDLNQIVKLVLRISRLTSLSSTYSYQH